MRYNLNLISPSGYGSSNACSLALCNWQTLGHNLCNAEILHRKHLRFGGIDIERIQDFNPHISNYYIDKQKVNILMPVRGGYGLNRIIDSVNWHKLADFVHSNDLKIVGHSDFNLVNLALLSLTNTCSFCGPMFASDFGHDEVNQFMLDNFNDAMQGKELNLVIKSFNNINSNTQEKISGILWGGNLAMLTTILGTKYCPKIKDGVLFLEDINEHPYRIERMLHQLYAHKILQQQKAIIFADFSDYKLTPYDNGYDFGTVLNYWAHKLKNVNIFSGLQFGHIRSKSTLKIGAMADIIYAQAQDNYILKIKN